MRKTQPRGKQIMRHCRNVHIWGSRWGAHWSIPGISKMEYINLCVYHTILIWYACTPWLRKSLNLAQTAEVICWIQASKRCHAPATPAALAGIVDIASDTAAQEVEVHTDAVGDGAWPRRRTALKNGIPNLNWFSSNSWWQSWGKSYVQTIVLRCTE